MSIKLGHRIGKPAQLANRLALLLAVLASRGRFFGAAVEPPPVSDQRVTELQGLRFGMFICWSVSTFSGKECTPGVKDVSFFKATACDTGQWARTQKGGRHGLLHHHRHAPRWLCDV